MSAEKTVGKTKLEDLTTKFADTIAQESKLGFGGKHVDYRNPLTKVEIYKKAEADALITYNGKTSEEIMAEAETFHKKTPSKFKKEGIPIPEGYYDTPTSPSEPEDKEDTTQPEEGHTTVTGTGANPSSLPGPNPDIPGFSAETPGPMTFGGFDEEDEDTTPPPSTSNNTSEDTTPAEDPKKSFDDYTEEELNNLSEDELNNLLDSSNNNNS